MVSWGCVHYLINLTNWTTKHRCATDSSQMLYFKTRKNLLLCFSISTNSTLMHGCLTMYRFYVPTCWCWFFMVSILMTFQYDNEVYILVQCVRFMTVNTSLDWQIKQSILLLQFSYLNVTSPLDLLLCINMYLLFIVCLIWGKNLKYSIYYILFLRIILPQNKIYCWQGKLQKE